ncbi:hypothetical protein CEXT_549581 [Caerostris extrusa]|uniref:Secreted protein n=1 Tax=Caerostris extrusa TaxID=172846 RepID=A0AAV4N6T0_CAEEX|nr:hypothetical protein CEXT_549581 [Caerostris extrusa]
MILTVFLVIILLACSSVLLNSARLSAPKQRKLRATEHIERSFEIRLLGSNTPEEAVMGEKNSPFRIARCKVFRRLHFDLSGLWTRPSPIQL